MYLPTPLRQIAWIATFIGLVVLLFGIADNLIHFILWGGGVFLVGVIICMFFGFTDEE